MDISVAVCDDLSSERGYLSRIIYSYFQTLNRPVQVDLFGSGRDLLFHFYPGKYHVIFLDIYMEEFSGLETARQLRQQDGNFSLVFATTSADYGVNSYEFRAADYLLKPFDLVDVRDALDYCIMELGDRLRTVEISSRWEPIQVPLLEIQYIEVQGHTVLIHTTRDCIPARRCLEELEADLNSPDFIRCHRSYLVNLNYALKLEEKEFLLTDGSRVPIGAHNRKKAKERFMEWSFEHAWSRK